LILLVIAFNLQMDKAEITAGDTLTLSWTFDKGVNYKLILPSKDSLRWIKIFSAKAKDKNVVLKITGFNPEKDTLPSLTFISSNEKDTVKTDPVVFRVKSVLKSKNTRPADIYGPFSMFNPLWLLYLLIPALAYITYLFIAKRKKKILSPKTPKLPPEPLSQRINKLWDKAENLLDKGYIKPFYITLSYIIRLYLKEVYKFPALEQTTYEIRDSLKKKKVKHRDEFLELLNFSDMVKFAKFIPDKETAFNHLNKSKGMVEVENGAG